jgi:hypothetical protein
MAPTFGSAHCDQARTIYGAYLRIGTLRPGKDDSWRLPSDRHTATRQGRFMAPTWRNARSSAGTAVYALYISVPATTSAVACAVVAGEEDRRR